MKSGDTDISVGGEKTEAGSFGGKIGVKSGDTDISVGGRGTDSTVSMTTAVCVDGEKVSVSVNGEGDDSV